MAIELKPLPYGYDALEPYIDEQTVRLHHDKHHAAYVSGLNAAFNGLEQARANKDFSLVQHFERLVAFHGAGHFNHSLYWENMGPGRSSEPSGDLAKRIERDFGSFANLKQELTQATVSVEGSGWGLLALEPFTGKLITLALLNHQNSMLVGATPLLICDVWEHAYYLKYQNRRADYVGAWWNVVNWQDVARRFEQVTKTFVAAPSGAR